MKTRVILFLLMPFLLVGCVNRAVVRPVFVDPTPIPGPFVPPDPVVPFDPPVDQPPIDEPVVVGDKAAILKDIDVRHTNGEVFTEAQVRAAAGGPSKPASFSHVDRMTVWKYKVLVNGETKDAELKFENGRLFSIIVGW